MIIVIMLHLKSEMTEETANKLKASTEEMKSEMKEMRAEMTLMLQLLHRQEQK